MKYFSMLIKPASSLCNYKCSYCFYNDVAAHRSESCLGIMSDQTVDSIIEKTIGYFNEPVTITYAFQGGEPTCAGIEYFKKFIAKVNENKSDFHVIQYAIQTNGSLLDDEWIKLLKKNNFLVGISLDGFQENHDYFRMNQQGEKTFDEIFSTYKKLVEYEIDVNVLTVLTSKLSKHAKKLYEFYKSNQIEYIQLIPCLPDLNNSDDNFALKPEEFASFYKEFFDEWVVELNSGMYRSVTFFDNMIPLFVGRPPQQCGFLGFCNVQFVLEADGSVYPCDFYVLDQYKLGNINNDSIVDLSKSKIATEFKNEKRRSCNECSVCKYYKICYGNCKRLNINYFSQEYCGIKDFLENREEEILAIARTL